MVNAKAPSAKAMSYDQVENTWIKAGGNPQAASMEAAIADASSGLNPNAQYTNPDGTIGIGLWLIEKNGMPPGSADPIANARAAIQQSNNGTDWSRWCVAWSDNACGCNGGSYLGEGSNALGSLAQGAEPGNYNVIGAAPSGDGTSATTLNDTTSPVSSGGGTGNKLLLVGGILVVSVGLFFLMRRQRAGGSAQPEVIAAQGV